MCPSVAGVLCPRCDRGAQHLPDPPAGSLPQLGAVQTWRTTDEGTRIVDRKRAEKLHGVYKIGVCVAGAAMSWQKESHRTG